MIIDLNGRWGGKLRNQDIEIVSGDTVTLRVTVDEGAAVKDLTGGTVLWGLSKLAGADTRLTASGTLSDPTNGQFTVAIPSTADISGNYYHEAEFTESGGDVGTVMRGTIRIDRDTV